MHSITDIEAVIVELKKQLDNEGIDRLGKIKKSGNNIMVSCPVHKDGQERKPSCGVSLKNGIVHCFTCDYVADLSQFISICFNKHDNGKFGARWLVRNFINYEGRHFSLETNDVIDNDNEPTNETELEKYRYFHPYMYKRKLTEEVIYQFDIGYDSETECITFPVRDKDGNLKFIFRRSVNSKFFSIPQDADKGSVLYGLNEVYKILPVKNIIVCESIIDALTCWGNNRPAVALMQAIATKTQVELLRKLPVKTITLALDNDNAGQAGSERIKKALKKDKIIYTAKFDGKDINDVENFGSILEVL